MNIRVRIKNQKARDVGIWTLGEKVGRSGVERQFELAGINFVFVLMFSESPNTDIRVFGLEKSVKGTVGFWSRIPQILGIWTLWVRYHATVLGFSIPVEEPLLLHKGGT